MNRRHQTTTSAPPAGALGMPVGSSLVFRYTLSSPMPHSSASIRRGTLIVVINACMFVFGAVLLLMGSLLPSLRLSGARAGALGSFPLIGILAATVLIGPILDKRGAKPTLAVGLGLVAAALVVMPSLASYGALAAAALAYGLGGGILNTATNAVVATLNPSQRGAALNLLGFSFSLGAIAAPLLTVLAEGRFSTILYVLALGSATILMIVLALRFPAPAHAATPLGSLLRVLNQPLVWLFGALLFFESGNENCMFVWAGKLTADLLRVTAARADLILVALSVALGAGRLLAVLWLKWIASRNLLLISTAVVLTGAIIVMTDLTFWGMMAGFAVIGLGMAAIFPTALGLAGDRFPGETGTVFGAVMAVALVGGVAGPAVGGLAASQNPVRVLAIPVVAALGVATLTLVVSGWKSRAARETAPEVRSLRS